jgi:hypothetical protein
MVLQDAAQGRLAPIYNFMKELPEIRGTPVPFLPKRSVARTLGLSASFDAGWPRMPVSVLILYHNQRPRPQVALPFGR